jgi:hypothetical protein
MVGQIPPPRSSDDAERNADNVLSRQLAPRSAATRHMGNGYLRQTDQAVEIALLRSKARTEPVTVFVP